MNEQKMHETIQKLIKKVYKLSEEVDFLTSDIYRQQAEIRHLREERQAQHER